jgi:hypothetical protein
MAVEANFLVVWWVGRIKKRKKCFGELEKRLERW